MLEHTKISNTGNTGMLDVDYSIRSSVNADHSVTESQSRHA